MIPRRTFNIHGTFPLEKFFEEPKMVLYGSPPSPTLAKKKKNYNYLVASR